MTVATNALLERRGARTALVTTEGFRDLIEIGAPGPPVALRPRRAPPASRSCRASCASPCASAWGPTASSSRSTRTASRDGGRRRCARPTSRRSRCACCSRSCTPSTSARVGEALREALPRRARVALERGAAGVPRVRALLDHRRRRLPRAEARRLPRAPGRRARTEAGVPGAAGDAVLGRRARRRAPRPSRPPAACSRARPAAWSARRTWRARAATRTC